MRRIGDVVDQHAALFRRDVEERTANLDATVAPWILDAIERSRDMRQQHRNRRAAAGRHGANLVEIKPVILDRHRHDSSGHRDVHRAARSVAQRIKHGAVRTVQIDDLQRSRQRRTARRRAVFLG